MIGTYHDRAATVRAELERESIGTRNDIRYRRQMGRTLRALTTRCETYLPVNVPTVRLEGSAWISERTDGTVPAHAQAPDPIEGSRHNVKRGRTKRGPTAVVTAYGMAHVIGSWYGAPVEHDNGAESYPALAEVLEGLGRLKRGARGMSALDVYKVTQRLYGEQIPALLSTDNDMHHAVIHGDDSDLDDYGVAWHNPSDPYGACDMLGRSIDDSPITYQTRGYGLTFGLPTECVVDRWKLARWLASKRETSSADAGRVMARRSRTGPERSLHWTSRFKLPMPTPRAGDPSAWREVRADGYGVVACVMLGAVAYCHHLLAPCDRLKGAPPSHLWRGHALIIRPEPRHGATVQGKRARVAVKRRTVDHVAVSTIADLLARFTTVLPGQRVTWQCGPRSGTFTRSADGRMSVSTPDGPLVKSVRTIDAVRIKLERAA